MVDTVCIKDIAWTAAFDASRRSHAYLQGADIVFSGTAPTRPRAWRKRKPE